MVLRASPPTAPLLQCGPRDPAGGRDRAGGVLQGAGGHRFRQVPRRVHLLAVTPPPVTSEAEPALVRSRRFRLHRVRRQLPPLVCGGAGPHNDSMSLRAQTLPSEAEGKSGDPHHSPPRPPRRPSICQKTLDL